MEILSLDFASALAAIVVIDLMLAGDNAIVIALAARNVPRSMQKRVIAWGTVGAILVRVLMTLGVVWLLRVPGLMFAGGALLVWIAYKLLVPSRQAHHHDDRPDKLVGFWAAMRTIIVADAVMGLDNVLAVAGAAHGSYVLVVLGLLISVPIVVWGSGLLLKWVERYPAIVYFGAGVLAWTAVKMMTAEPVVREALEHESALAWLAYAAVIGGVLRAGFVHNHRRLESRIHARLARLLAPQGEPMKCVLVPVGDRNAEFAVQHVIRERMRNPTLEIHLLNVQRPFSRHVSQFVRRRWLEQFHRDEAERALAPARKLLARYSVPFSAHVQIGDRAHMIAAEARRLACDHIVMSTARSGSLTRMLEDSTTDRVLELTDIPVELVAGRRVSRFERYALPAGMASALALLIAEALD